MAVTNGYNSGNGELWAYPNIRHEPGLIIALEDDCSVLGYEDVRNLIPYLQGWLDEQPKPFPFKDGDILKFRSDAWLYEVQNGEITYGQVRVSEQDPSFYVRVGRLD